MYIYICVYIYIHICIEGERDLTNDNNLNNKTTSYIRTMTHITYLFNYNTDVVSVLMLQL